MARLMIHRRILKEFSKLPPKVQKRISELVQEFEDDPQAPSLGLHQLTESMLDPKVRGLKGLPGGYRGIVIAPERGDTYLLVYVDSHDKAYEWAKNKRFEVHLGTGVFQIFDTEEVHAAAARQPGGDAPATVASTGSYALAALSDDELFQAGVPRPLIPAVRTLRSDRDLEALSEYLPPDCRDVLIGIAAGMGLEESLEQMLGAASGGSPEARPEGPGDFRQIDQRPSFDLVEVKGAEELKDILSRSLEEWRVFLHPYQKALVEKRTQGPMNIHGAAGTGKTVALMHRAVHLARALTSPTERILLTTYTTNLSITLKSQIEKLAPQESRRIEVTNLHSLSRSICQRAGWTGRIAEPQDSADLWKTVLSDTDLSGLPLKPAELIEEYDQVVDANGIDEEEAYLTALRTGRGSRLDRKQRRQIWPIFREFQRSLKKRNLLTIEGAIHQARLAVENGVMPRYRHVLVDEVQDFSLEALRLIRSLAPIEEKLLDPLLTVGDGHQRIYRNKIPMSRAGIEVRGRRSFRLKINYRTTQQIRKFAHRLLEGLEIDDLDGERVSTQGDHSVMTGSEPTVVSCSSEEEEAEVVVQWIKQLMDHPGLKDHEICVTPHRSHLHAALKHAGIEVFELRDRALDPGQDERGVRMGSRPRIKGLEFRAVVLSGADPADAINDMEHASLLERCQRYVAATRAREFLLVTHGKLASTSPLQSGSDTSAGLRQ